MNKQQFKASINELHERLLALTAAKGEEYTQRAQSQFVNFEASAARLGLTREQVLMVALDKHMFSVTTWVNDIARGEDRQYAEPITGRVDDAILYLLLLRGMMTERLHGSMARQLEREAAHAAQEPAGDHHWLLADAGTHSVRAQAPAAIVCRSHTKGMACRAAHGLAQHTGVHVTTHPDSLHGISAGAHVWLVREDGDGGFADEVSRACAKHSLRLYFACGSTVEEAPAHA